MTLPKTNVVAAVKVGAAPYSVAVSPDGKKVYVTNSRYYGNVSVIDTGTDIVTATVPVGNNPLGVAVSPDGEKVCVTNGQDGTVSVIATKNNTVIATLPVGNLPHGVSVTPDGTKVYVVNTASNNVSVIDAKTNAVTAISVGIYPHAFGQFIGHVSVPEADFYSPEVDNIFDGVIDRGISENDIVSFFDKSTGSPASWLWDFGDGSTSTLKNPTHAYEKIGGYTVNLTVKNMAGSDTVSKYGYILVGIWGDGHASPAYFSSDITSGNAPLKVTFFDDQNANRDNVMRREWNFGDGFIQYNVSDDNTSPHATHTYEKPGKYTVTLYLDNGGGKSIITKYNYITVTDPVKDPQMLVAKFSSKVTKGYAPLTVQFTDLSQNTTGVSWDFDNDGLADIENYGQIIIEKDPNIIDGNPKVLFTYTLSRGTILLN